MIGAAWMLLQATYTNIAGLVGVIVVARLVAPAEFGLVALAAVFVSLATVVSDLGLTPALIRLHHPTRLQVNTAFWCGIALSLCLAGIIALFSGVLAQAFEQPKLEPLLWVLSLQIPLASLRLVPVTTLTRQLNFRPLAVRQVLAQTAGVILGVSIALAGGGAWALVAQSVGAVLVDVVAVWCFSPWRPHREFSAGEARKLLTIGVPALGVELVHLGRDRGVDLIIAAALGAHALGIWTVATRVTSTVVQLFSTVLNQVSLPVLAHVRDDRDRLHRVFKRAVRTSAGVALPGMLGLAAISPTAIPLIFGEQWSEAGRIAELTSLATGIVIIQWLDTNLWLALGKTKVELYLVLGISILQFGAVVITAPLGLTAVAIALTARTLISVPVRIATVVKIAGLPISTYADVPRVLLCCIPMYAVVFAVSRWLAEWPHLWLLLAEVLLGAVTYVGAALFLQRSAVAELVGDVRGAVGATNAV